MKKIATFLLAISSITIASAQSAKQKANPNDRDGRDARDIAIHNRNDIRNNKPNDKDYNAYFFSAKERDARIKEINKDYNKRITAVKRDKHLRSNEKNVQIRRLELQRDEEINRVNRRFTASNNMHKDNAYAKGSNNRRW